MELTAELPRLHPADLAALADMIAERLTAAERPVHAAPSDDADKPCDLDEAAALAGCSVRTMRRHIQTGRISAWRIGADPTSTSAPLRVARGDALALRDAGAVKPEPSSTPPSTSVRRGPRPRVRAKRTPPRSRARLQSVTGLQSKQPRVQTRDAIREQAATVRERLGRAA